MEYLSSDTYVTTMHAVLHEKKLHWGWIKSINVAQGCTITKTNPVYIISDLKNTLTNACLEISSSSF